MGPSIFGWNGTADYRRIWRHAAAGMVAGWKNDRVPVVSRWRLAHLDDRYAADALGAAADLGTIQSGKLADLIVVEGNPLEDIRAARRVRITVRNGEVFTLRSLLRATQ